MKAKIASAMAILIASFVLCVQAQTPTGTISGEVRDSSGAVVADAPVKITNVSTNETKQLKTDNGGRYVQPFLNPGKYTVEVEATGFRPARQESVEGEVGLIRPIDFTLTVGNVS